MNLKILVTTILSFILMGCTDWLEVDPYDRVLEENTFDNETNIQAALNGVYLQMAENNLYGNELTARTIELLAQQYYISPSFENSSSDAVKLRFYMSDYNYGVKLTKSKFLSIWERGYNLILGINNFIKKLEETPSNIIVADRRDILLGEAYGLRAYMHLDLLRLYGPVYATDSTNISIPYHTKPSVDFNTRIAASEIMDYIISDIDQAILLLENDPVRVEGVMTAPTEDLTSSQVAIDPFYRYRNRRLNYYAAKALKVRALMYRNDKSAASELAKSLLINDKITKVFPWTDSKTAFLPTKEDRFFSSEVLFGIHSYNMYENWDSYFNTGIDDPTITYAVEESYKNKIFDITANAGNTPDMRDSNFKLWSPQNSQANFMALIRTKKSSVQTAAWYYQPLIRKSELFYAIAETDNNVAYLDSVRVNRGLKTVEDRNPIYDLETEITNEYIREFKLEGQLFYYYKRKFIETIQSATSATTTVSMTKNKYIIPIPDEEINW